jgi:[protein-PII] uridylyltransferase
MGLPDDEIRTLRSLVEHHLLLAETATRRDLSDPRTAALAAEAVGDKDTLDLLAALTEADSRATGPAAWSSWKQALIEELVLVTRAVLHGGQVAPPAPDASRFAHLARLVEADGAMHIEHVDQGDVDLLRIASRDRTGLFAQIAGVLALHGLDVLSASAATGADGVAVDEFRVAKLDAALPNWQRIEHDLRAAAAGEIDIDSRLEHRLRSARRRRPLAAAPARLEVLLSNEASATTTVVEVRAADAPAVLYRLSHALTDLDLDVRSAVVATLGHEVVDAFYVTTRKSPTGRVPAGDFEAIRAALIAALSA